MIKFVRLSFFLLVFCCALLSRGQNQAKPSDTSHRFFKQMPLYTDSSGYDANWSYLGQTGMDTGIALINYSPIDSISVKKHRNAAIYPDTASRYLEYEDDSFFVIKVDGKFRKYNKEYNLNYSRRNNFSWTEYKGYFPELGWYVLFGAAIGENLFLGAGELVRKSDAKDYDIIGISDGGTSEVIMAPDRRTMLIFDNATYSNESYVALVGIDSINGQIDFKLLGVQYFENSFSSVIWPENGNPILLFNLVYTGDDGWEGAATEYIELIISDLPPK